MKNLKYIAVFLFLFFLNYSAGWLHYVYNLNQSFIVNPNLSNVNSFFTNNKIFTYELIFKNIKIIKYALLISFSSTLFLIYLFKLEKLKKENNLNPLNNA
jgi:hypothetical protein